jgi:hypothetical protein
MENTHFCQSCSMPIDDPALRGTEKDGSKSTEYCTYCYQNGAFVNPDMTLEQMQSLVVEKMDDNKLPEDILEAAVARLPHLKRWNRTYIL